MSGVSHPGPKSNLTLTIAQVGAVATEVFAEQMMNPKEEMERAMKPDKCARILLGKDIFLFLFFHNCTSE
jgi:hypothetical protein